MSQPAPARDVVYERTNRRLVLPDGKRVSFVTEEELAVILFKPPDELQKWRVDGRFPELEFTLIGKLIRYPADAVIAYLEKRTFTTTKEAGTAVSAKSNRLRSQKMKARWAEKKAAKAVADAKS